MKDGNGRSRAKDTTHKAADERASRPEFSWHSHARNGNLTWEMLQFERQSLLRNPFVPDSVQGYLEYAKYFNAGDPKYRDRIVFSASGADKHGTHLYEFNQLAKEGYINLDLSPPDEKDDCLLLDISLTTRGRQLLADLESKSKVGRLKSILVTIIVAIVTSALTTIVANYFFGKP